MANYITSGSQCVSFCSLTRKFHNDYNNNKKKYKNNVLRIREKTAIMTKDAIFH